MSFKAEDILFAPITADGAVEQVFRRIGEAIGSGLMSAGTKLPSETELARLLRVSPMTVRQALAALRAEGYIETRRGRGGGSFVQDNALERRTGTNQQAEWNPDQLEELTAWRCAVSGEAAARAATLRTETHVSQLRQSQQAATTQTARASQYRAKDAHFHIQIAEISASRRLLAAEIEIQHELSDLIAPVPGAEIVRVTSGHGHGPIVDSIEQGDPDLSRQSVIRHAEATRDWLIGLHLGDTGQPHHTNTNAS